MSNSPLVNYTRISPNSNNPRKYPITKITIHHAGCVASVEVMGNGFAQKSRQASANYGIGSDGRVGMYVEEANRAWTSSNRDNDERAITIEVSNSAKGGNWPVSDKVLAKLIDLCVDICKRNNIKKLNYTGDKNGNLTRHNMFARTTCPGPYLQQKFPYIAEQVNARLTAETKKEEPKKEEPKKETPVVNTKPAQKNFNVGDVVMFTGTKHYRSATAVLGSSCSAGQAEITRFVAGKAHPYHVIRTDKKGPYGWVNAADLVAIADDEDEPWIPAVGDIVMFNGGNQYNSANSTVATTAKKGKAKITKIYKLGQSRHPYHLKRTSGVGPYGWVDVGTFTQE